MLSGFFQTLKRFFRRRGARLEPSFALPDAAEILRQPYSHTQEVEGPGGAITAREAYQLAHDIIEAYDERARLTGIESLSALFANGQCNGWKFTFSLPDRWGYAIFLFKMGHPDLLTVELSPFVEVGSGIAKMMEQGQKGFVEQQWKVELERSRELGPHFADSSEVVAAFIAGGKSQMPQGAVLRASSPPLGKSRWDLFGAGDLKKSLYTYPIE